MGTGRRDGGRLVLQAVRYFGTDVEVRLGDAVKMRRWFRNVSAVIVYVPGISQPNAFFGRHHVGVRTEDQRYYGIIVEEGGILWKTVVFNARGVAPPSELPNDLDEA